MPECLGPRKYKDHTTLRSCGSAADGLVSDDLFDAYRLVSKWRLSLRGAMPNFLSVLEELCASSRVERWHTWGADDSVCILGKRESKEEPISVHAECNGKTRQRTSAIQKSWR